MPPSALDPKAEDVAANEGQAQPQADGDSRPPSETAETPEPGPITTTTGNRGGVS
jgi:hypothetical protein